MKSLLFIDGEAPDELPDPRDYTLIGCTDGAFHYLKQKKFPLQELTFVAGDFDSYQPGDEHGFELIPTPDQDFTDFEKSLAILEKKGATSVDVYGGSGGEMDHFLGNLTAAYQFKNKLKITFYDFYSRYFFVSKKTKLKVEKGQLVSLYPFPVAENVVTTGLHWPLCNENLDMRSRIGTRNYAVDDTVTVQLEKGDLVVFVGSYFYNGV